MVVLNLAESAKKKSPKITQIQVCVETILCIFTPYMWSLKNAPFFAPWKIFGHEKKRPSANVYVPRIISHRSASPLKFINVDRCDLCTWNSRCGFFLLSRGFFGKRSMKNCAGKKCWGAPIWKKGCCSLCVCVKPLFFGWKVKTSLVKSRELIKTKALSKSRKICWVTNYTPEI